MEREVVGKWDLSECGSRHCPLLSLQRTVTTIQLRMSPGAGSYASSVPPLVPQDLEGGLADPESCPA